MWITQLTNTLTDIGQWEAWSLVSKLFVLIGAGMVTGGMFSLCLGRGFGDDVIGRLSRYTILGAVLGLTATIVTFLTQLGAINQNGLRGMFDLQMGLIIGQSPLGYATAARLGGFTIAIAAMLMWHDRDRWRLSSLHAVLGLGALAVLFLSFTVMGHVTDLGILVRLSIVIHVAAVFLWIGSLYPLWLFCRANVSTEQLKAVMEKFGRMAIYFVALLLAAGIYLLTQLLSSIDQLFSTPYGQAMLIKLLAVVALLTLGALNKFLLVPRLDADTGRQSLARSIGFEMILALGILVMTAYLTTNVGL